MKRELELIRKILLKIEDDPGGWAPADLTCDGYTSEQVGYHAYLLIDGGYAQGEDISWGASQGPRSMIRTLTWKGHEFAAAARDDTRWNEVMGIVAKKGGSITVEILTQLLAGHMRKAFGLP